MDTKTTVWDLSKKRRPYGVGLMDETESNKKMHALVSQLAGSLLGLMNYTHDRGLSSVLVGPFSNHHTPVLLNWPIKCNAEPKKKKSAIYNLKNNNSSNKVSH